MALKNVFFLLSFGEVKNPIEVVRLGKKVKELREKANLSQLELSIEADVGLRTLQRLEAGENAASIDIIFSLSKAFNIEPAIFFEN